ncbi:MAG: 30S ribosomal protein S2 [Bosea sp. (in: a-proteobacteria)]|jgi:small subunit ribosomal protein S2|uniref:30S ribosomal protein S2 n=1 Tax=unclassified Bosea (in: a-proteobacteria) TaxID=2653178 RepID=UPI00083D8759|nr:MULTISPECIES: 30S ribosomal protein S2 [unclassified Bosea (in: a-proteobacteria)]AOG06122.1 ribosomal protein S2 [Bosea sp. RAC05]MCZ8042872.1 30S ribosomal protein S2 [Beijerinckiaceae bacterium]MDP3603692.1 30S ribosomal protein S2 [Bosea sp. (in: a-proteobacteria)]WRH58901.1 MAG: 30S ribosomal protein S2 [Bosea sp. (in: a-proteobacteria)]
MALPDFSMRQLLEAGAHFGHQAHRWNPKMSPYIFGTRNNIHILDLSQSVPMLSRALQAVSDTVARGGRVLFVGTKRQAQDAIADAAKRSAQYYVNSRWLGGMLTNWKTISASIQRLRKVDELLAGGGSGLTKKERLMLARERDKLEKALGGIKDMGGTPDMIFVIDTNKEALAIKEAQRLGIPVAAIIDSNSDPDGITFPVPANDDAGRAIQLYCDLVARSAIDGISRASGDHGVDIGAAEAPMIIEEALAEPAAADAGVPFELLTAPRGAPDDLMKLSGMGPELVQKLNDGGLFHFWQFAAMSPADLTKIDQDLKLGGRIEREGWVAQARELADA